MLHLVAGGDAGLPLRLRSQGRARGDGGDYVELRVAGAPDGLLAQAAPDAVNLFAQGHAALAPALQIVTAPTLTPGRYTLVVTARQHLSGRVVMMRVRVLVIPGRPLASSTGPSTRRGSVNSVQSALAAGANPPVGGTRRTTPSPALHAVVHAPRPTTARRHGRVRLRPLAIVRIAPLSTLLHGHRGLRPHVSPADVGDTCTAPPQDSFTGASWPLPGVTTTDASGHDVPVMVSPSDFLTRNPQTVGQAPYTTASTAYGQGYLSVQGESVMGAAELPHSTAAITTFYGPLQYLPLTNVTDVLTTTDTGAVRPALRDAGLSQYYCQTFVWETCDDIGRAQGIVALITTSATRTKAREFNRPNDSYAKVTITPPGYDRSIHHQGHLLGYVLDGPPDDPRNFIAEYKLANTSVQGALEKVLARVLTNQEPMLFYRVIPRYHEGNTEAIPYEIYLEAVGPNGFHTSCTIENTATVQKMGSCGRNDG